MLSLVYKTYLDGGPWMLPVLLVGCIGIAASVAGGFARKSPSPWVYSSLAMCLSLGLIGTAWNMHEILGFVDSNEKLRLWFLFPRALAGLLPATLSFFLSALGLAALALTDAFRSQATPWKTAGLAADRLLASSILSGVALLSWSIPHMFYGMDMLDPTWSVHTKLAHGLASTAQYVFWPGIVTLVLLVVRVLLHRFPLQEPPS